MNKFHPAWYRFEPGETLTDLSFTDSLNFFVNHVRNVCVTLQLAIDCEHSEMCDETLTSTLWMLQQQAAEAKALVDQWYEIKLQPEAGKEEGES